MTSNSSWPIQHAGPQSWLRTPTPPAWPSAIAVAGQVLVPRDSMQAPRDDAGLAWHDITGPSAESEPDPSTR